MPSTRRAMRAVAVQMPIARLRSRTWCMFARFVLCCKLVVDQQANMNKTQR